MNVDFHYAHSEDTQTVFPISNTPSCVCFWVFPYLRNFKCPTLVGIDSAAAGAASCPPLAISINKSTHNCAIV